MSNVPFWIRQTEILAGGKRFHSDELDIEFKIPFDNDEEPDIAKITIYNLSENSINSITKNQNIIINAGYKGDIGTLFMGTLQKAETKWSGVDKVSAFTIGDGAMQWLTKKVSEAYCENITSAAILQDLTSRFGLELGRLQLVNNLTYPKGRVIDAMLKDAVKQVVKETESQFKISGGKIYIMPQNSGIQTGFLLNKNTGLIGSPEVFEKEEGGKTKKGFKITMLLNHRVTVNSIIQVESKTANGIYKILKGKHRCGADFLTEVEVVE
ncbi:MAG: hypothetical protein FWD01_03140 [Defluviitaleaceae bacterium]|nr:hypothetical protein [Defluviitaleaceae bacterium]